MKSLEEREEQSGPWQRATVGGLACTTMDAVPVREIGSFHVGGRPVTLSGLPVREVRFAPSTPPARFDPNGEFETGQMYVQYVRLAAQDAASRC